MALFLAHVLLPFTSYVPHTTPPTAPLTLAVGADSREQLLHRTAAFLAARYSSDLVEFPGGHIGAVEHPEAFAERLVETLAGSLRPNRHAGDVDA
ncbi:hypothetical protein [Streptomyces sp. JNUCC 63]